MDLVIKLFVIICSIFISNVKTTPHHCCPNSAIVSARRCKDGSNISIACDEYPLILDPSRGSYFQFFTGTDTDPENEGKDYLDAFNAGFLIYQPYFCTGSIQYTFTNRTSDNVAITCASYRKWYKDVKVQGSESVKTARSSRIFYYLTTVFNTASAIFLLLAAVIYYTLPSVRDVQGTCYFFFSLIAGLGHSTLTYMDIFGTVGLLPNMCITNTYLLCYLILCAVSWSTVTSYHIWRTAMNYNTDDEAELLKRYKIYGFGLPFGLIFCAWVHVHLKNIADLTFVLDCYDHQRVIYELYVAIPLLLSIFLNFIMFIHSQIRIWNLHSIQLQDKKLTMKILKYRLFMNAKLFFVMGVPWALLLLISFMRYSVAFSDNVVGRVIETLANLLVLMEGIPIFLILVVFRKRVLRGIAKKWFGNTKILPEKWRTTKDSETEEEVSDSETPSGSPEAKYTPNNIDQDKNILDESTIVVL